MQYLNVSFDGQKSSCDLSSDSEWKYQERLSEKSETHYACAIWLTDCFTVENQKLNIHQY